MGMMPIYQQAFMYAAAHAGFWMALRPLIAAFECLCLAVWQCRFRNVGVARTKLNFNSIFSVWYAYTPAGVVVPMFVSVCK